MDKKAVTKVAKLSRLYVDDAEKEKMAAQLSNIFDWIDQLNEVNTDDVKEMSGVGDYSLRMRKDEAIQNRTRDDIMANAPESSLGFFVVPKVIE